jgi:NDP-sugar pyrophosphorylase family protein
MKAMIFAAGKGTRLRPLTDKIPKALVRVNKKTVLESLIVKLINNGVEEIIINVHHHAQQIISYIHGKDDFGIKITFSEEHVLLDTGGGLKKAAWFFNHKEPFIIHNVDILSDINLKEMYKFHLNNNALATLAVKERQTSRYLLFDADRILVGRQANQKIITARPDFDVRRTNRLSFLGIHIVSPELFKYLPGDEIFSILDLYLDAAAQGARIKACAAPHTYWFDLGKPETIRSAREYFKQKEAHEDKKSE